MKFSRWLPAIDIRPAGPPDRSASACATLAFWHTYLCCFDVRNGSEPT